MTVFTALSALNVVLTVALMVASASKFNRSKNDVLKQIVITPLFLAIGLVVMHLYTMTRPIDDVRDLESMVWRLLDAFNLIVMVRLLKAIPND